MIQRRNKERGSVIVVLALFIVFLLCFVAFGTEAGRWYLLRAEISKSVDAAALVGAKNISNPHVDPRQLAEEYCAENFPTGAFGTPGVGPGTATFTVEQRDDNQIHVSGRATSPAIMAQLLGIHDVPVGSLGAAQMRPVEIMLVLDRSGSMSGQPIADLKVAAKSFIDYFQDTQNTDKMGLVSFATAVRVDRALGNDFVAPMRTAINGMSANDYTNAEDAIHQAGGPKGFTNQNGVPPESRIRQVLVFFSDGRPNVFRSQFRRSGVVYDALVRVGGGNCDPGDNNQVYANLMNPANGANLTAGSMPTGDGIIPSRCGATKQTTRWYILDQNPVPGYAPDACGIPQAALHDQLCEVASFKAVQNAQALKDAGVSVFTIGLGENIHTDFLEALASSPQQVYMAPTSDDLLAIFQRVAQDIKLRLVL